MSEMKDCPFCGTKPEIKQTGKAKLTLKCPKCLIGITQKTLRFSLEWLNNRMIEDWNKRICESTIQELKDRIKELEEENSDLRGTVQTRDAEFEKRSKELEEQDNNIEVAIKHFEKRSEDFNGKFSAEEVLRVLYFLKQCRDQKMKLTGIGYVTYEGGKKYEELAPSQMYEGGFSVAQKSNHDPTN